MFPKKQKLVEQALTGNSGGTNVLKKMVDLTGNKYREEEASSICAEVPPCELMKARRIRTESENQNTLCGAEEI